MKKITVQLSLNQYQNIHPRVIKQMIDDYLIFSFPENKFELVDSFTIKMEINLEHSNSLKDCMNEFFEFINTWLNNWYLGEEKNFDVQDNETLVCA